MLDFSKFQIGDLIICRYSSSYFSQTGWSIDFGFLTNLQEYSFFWDKPWYALFENKVNLLAVHAVQKIKTLEEFFTMDILYNYDDSLFPVRVNSFRNWLAQENINKFLTSKYFVLREYARAQLLI